MTFKLVYDQNYVDRKKYEMRSWKKWQGGASHQPSPLDNSDTLLNIPYVNITQKNTDAFS